MEINKYKRIPIDPMNSDVWRTFNEDKAVLFYRAIKEMDLFSDIKANAHLIKIIFQNYKSNKSYAYFYKNTKTIESEKEKSYKSWYDYYKEALNHITIGHANYDFYCAELDGSLELYDAVCYFNNNGGNFHNELTEAYKLAISFDQDNTIQ